MNGYVLSVPVTALAFFGPSGSGKSTFIEELLKRHPQRFVQPYIVTTRPPRETVQPEKRRFISREDFLQEVEAGEMVYASEHYGHWHGTRKTHLEELAQTGKLFIMDPNQFPRLSMLEMLFSKGRLVVMHFVPLALETIETVSNEDLKGIFAARLGLRGDTAGEERRLRIEEAVETMRECCKRNPKNIMVNDFAVPFEKRFSMFENMLRAELPELY